MKISKIVFCSLAAVLTTARGEFTLIENFDTLTLDALDGQNDWTADTNYSVIADPDDATNQVLQYEAPGVTGAYKDLMDNSVADNETGTLFFRFRFDASGNANTGFSDVAEPNNYPDFESQLSRQAGTVLRGRDDSAFQDLASEDMSLSVEEPDTWYNIWLVADNATDSSRVFVQSDDDSNFSTQTEILTPDGTMNFRNGTSDALTTLKLRSQEGVAFWDDFYFSPGEDLTNPITTTPPNPDITVQITSLEYIPGTVAELTWEAIDKHQYAVQTSGSLDDDWTTLDTRVTASSTSAMVELFDADITPINGRLFFRIEDLGISAE